MKIVERTKSLRLVVRTNIELTSAMNKRIEDYCREFGWSKRRLIEDAINCWLNARDLEKIERQKKNEAK